MSLAIGPHIFDPQRRTLTRGDRVVELGQKASDLLLALLEAQGEPASKAALMDRVWPDTVVEEGNLTVQIATLRRHLGTDDQGRDWIVTVPRVGYRLVAAAAQPATASRSAIPQIGVQRFDSLGSDPGQEYFADGIVQDITMALSRFTAFTVLAPGAQETALSGARYLLGGSLRRMGGRFRISAQLTDRETGACLWADRFDAEVGQIFDVQDSITASVAAHVAPQIERAEIERSRRKPPDSLDAYDYYLRALQKQATFAEADNREALALLDRAIALAPGFGAALAAAAYGHEHRVTMGWPAASADDGARAMELARAAVAASEGDAQVLAHCGFIFMAIGRDYDLGRQTILRAARRNPVNPEVLMTAGAAHVWAGDLDQALSFFQRGIEISPGQTHGAMTGMAHVMLLQGRHEEALHWTARALAEQPNFDVTHWLAIAALGHLGRLDQARRAIDTLLALAPDTTIARIAAAHHGKFPERMAVVLDGMRLAGMPPG